MRESRAIVGARSEGSTRVSYTIDLSGRVALVTGASSGLGAQFARTLGKAGAAVVLAARRVERLKTLRAEIEAAGGEIALELVELVAVDAGIDGAARVGVGGRAPPQQRHEQEQQGERDEDRRGNQKAGHGFSSLSPSLSSSSAFFCSSALRFAGATRRARRRRMITSPATPASSSANGPNQSSSVVPFSGGR